MRTRGLWSRDRRRAARDRSSLMTSDGQEPTRNSRRISGRRSSSLVDRLVQFLVHVGHPGQIAFLDDGGGEARLGEDHDAGGRLDQVGAGAGADHQEEGVLDLAVEPDDAGQAAEDFALAALLKHRGLGSAVIVPPPARSKRRDGMSAAVAAPGGAQLQDELGGVDDVGGIGGERQDHLALRAQRVEGHRRQISGMQRQHQHAEDVFPVEGGGEQVAAEHHLLPDAAGDHDRVEGQRLDHHRGGGDAKPFAGRQIPEHEAQAGKKNDELDGGQDALNKCPGRSVAAFPFFRRIKWRVPTLFHYVLPGMRWVAGCGGWNPIRASAPFPDPLLTRTLNP